MSRPVITDRVLVRIYIEGVLFPYAKSVMVTESEGSVRCQIEVPPSIKLKPEQWAGATLHIFYANGRVLETSPEGTAVDKGWVNPGKSPDDKGWPILFQGELSGESTQATVQSETIMLTAVGHSRHFEQTILFFYDFSKNSVIEANAQAKFLGAQQINIETSGLLSKQSQILQVMSTRIAALSSDSERNIAFTSAILDILRSTKKQNPLYNHFDTKLRLSQRFASYVDPDVKEMLRLEQMAHLADQRAQTLPSYSSIMQVLDLAVGLVHYNWNHLAQPQLRRAAIDQLQYFGRTVTDDFYDTAERVEEAVKQFANQVSPGRKTVNTVLGPVTVPNDYFDRQNPVMSQKEFARIVLDLNSDQPILGMWEMVKNYDRPEADAKMSKKSVVGNAIDKLQQTLDAANQEEKKDAEIGSTLELLEFEQAALEARDELNEFIITPNLRFSHPPKCNVFFPATMTSYGIQRDHFREPTRLYGRIPLPPSSANKGQGMYQWVIAPFSAAYHHLDGDNLVNFSDEYKKYVRERMKEYYVDKSAETDALAGDQDNRDGADADFNNGN